MNKLIQIALSGCIIFNMVNANADQATPEQEKTLQASYQAYLKSQGLTLSTQGVQVVPREDIKLPEALRKQVIADRKSMLQQGYVEKSNPRILELRDIDHTAVYEKKKYKDNTDPASTHLRDTVSEIKTAYIFHEVPTEEANHIIGFAPVGTYIDNGWTGMVELFTKQGLGNCNYEENNLKLMRSSIRIPSDIVTHQINEKVTTIEVEGNKKDGFLYTVEWYDDNFSRKLECVTSDYSKALLATVIDTAKRIDS